MRNNIQQMEDLRVRIDNLSKDIGTFHDGITLREQIQNSVHELNNLNLSFKDQIDQMKRNKDKTREFYQIQAEFGDLNRRISFTLSHLDTSVLNSASKRDHSIELQTTPLLDQSTNIHYMNNQYMNIHYMNDQYMNDQYIEEQKTVTEVFSLIERTLQELESQRNLIIAIQNMKIENEQLDKPSSHKKGSRKALCVIFIIIIIVVLGIGVVFLIQYFRKDKKKRED